MLTWKDFPRKTDRVAIVGFAPSTREEAPFDDPDCEIWILNEEYNFPWCRRFDRLFQIHQEWDFRRDNNMNDPNHEWWLRNMSATCKNCKGAGELVPVNGKEPVKCAYCNNGTYAPANRADIPIYMQKAFDFIPGAIEFPLAEVSAFLGQKYFRSGFSYMMSMAMFLGYPRIEIYGFEMGTDTEYNYQKPNGEWLIGLAQGRGIDVYLPEKCTLLKGPVYGYEDSRIGYRQNLEIRKLVLDNQIKKQKAAVERADAEANLIKFLVDHPGTDLMTLLTEKALAFNKANGLLNFVRGAKTETENITTMYNKYFSGPTEQEDPIAYNYKITQENVKVEYAPED